MKANEKGMRDEKQPWTCRRKRRYSFEYNVEILRLREVSTLTIPCIIYMISFVLVPISTPFVRAAFSEDKPTLK